jgi:hypothetical protein
MSLTAPAVVAWLSALMQLVPVTNAHGGRVGQINGWRLVEGLLLQPLYSASNKAF